VIPSASQNTKQKLKALVVKADNKLVDLQRTLETHHAADEVTPKLQLASLPLSSVTFCSFVR
jgi:hypothetical protein